MITTLNKGNRANGPISIRSYNWQRTVRCEEFKDDQEDLCGKADKRYRHYVDVAQEEFKPRLANLPQSGVKVTKSLPPIIF
jgi:hypothetical protein